jgi:glutathione S-transferase
VIPERWYPKQDFRKLAKIEEFLNWNHNTLFVTVGKIYIEEFVQLFWDVESIPHGMLVNCKNPLKFALIEDSLDQLENIWLKDTKFLVEDQPTFADLIASCVLMQVLGLKIYELG